METEKRYDDIVFGLDIGTRNVVGTVGYKEGDNFYVVAQHVRQHETRSMLDGQIHNIGRVGNTIRIVKEELESQIGDKLTEVCIAAAGRVLKTVTTQIEYEFPEETVVTDEHIHTMDLLGIEKAQSILKEKNDTRYKFYCVGYSVVKYYLNDEHFISIEGHKADKIAEDIIVTFLPEDVVDGLYSAVAKADMEVANLTLEPIAAINVAIPESFRMLNLALVDVGAGTSDISVTKEGSIIAYGMIPYAGDEITELLVQSYLVDFKTAEKIKLDSGTEKTVEYKDIMGITHKLDAEEVWKLVDPVVEKITTEVANKIKELNGDNSVAATFVVGGGGKVHGFTEKLAQKLDLPQERVALRGEEVLQEVNFEQEDIKKDPLLVTPIGICMNYYDQKNNFIMVHFNGERIKLYDNNKLTIVDAAMEAGFPNELLFPKRGKEINFTVNGKQRISRGEAGESAIVKVNDRVVNINEPLEPNSYITIEPSTAGAAAHCTIGDLEEYTSSTINFIVNGKVISCPKFMEVNGGLEPAFYEIHEGDVINTRSFYTVKQLAEFMDVTIDTDHQIYVNNESVGLDAMVYENFSVEWETKNVEFLPNVIEEEVKLSQQEILRNQQNGEDVDIEIGQGVQRQIEMKNGDMPQLPEKDASTDNVIKFENTKSNVIVEFSKEMDSEVEVSTLHNNGTDGNVIDIASVDTKAPENVIELGNVNADLEQSVEVDSVDEKVEVSDEAPGAEEADDVTEADPVEDEQYTEMQEDAYTEQKIGNGYVRQDDTFDGFQYYEEAKPELQIIVNQRPVVLTGKNEYIYVDVFDFIDFDLSDSRGRAIVTKLNGGNAQFSQKLRANDRIEIYWKEN